MKLETNLDKIKAIAEYNKDKNWQFRRLLKMKDGDRLDRTVHHLYQKVTKIIECTKCANCCKVYSTLLTKNDINKLAEHLKITEEDFLKQFMELDLEENELYIKSKPCCFLKDNKCSVYECIPEDCKSFPHLHKNDFQSRLMSVVENYDMCPIVFNVYELLKQELNFH